MNDNRLLEGKVALITGTGGGQGRAAAQLFAAHGAKVVGCDIKVEGAEETVRLVRAAGGVMASMQPVDLGDEQAVQKWVDFAVAQFGDFDILYNNAAATCFGRIETMSLDDWHFGLRNELTLQFLPTRAAIPVFRRRGGGTIVNTSSIIGYERGAVAPGGVVHAIAKAGINAFTQHLAVELAPLGVRVNAIAPGAINTPALAALLADPDSPFRAAQLAAQLVQRLGAAEDCARAALFLASDHASFINGAILPVDGGLAIAGRTATVFDAFNTTSFNESETTRTAAAVNR